MPDRHSTPVQPCSTTLCTSESQSTPAPARTSGVGPSRNSVPPTVIRTTSPGNPESRKTTLLPPPSTYTGKRRSGVGERCADLVLRIALDEVAGVAAHHERGI